MEVIRTVQTVKNGQVLLDLPPELSGQQVEIVVFTKKNNPVQRKSLKGVLQSYAKPDLISLESTAGENAAGEKYGDR
ncbi:hypothetical protein [Oscillatoria acuminata]|uniref:Uncharacterized protein n=1 Tax=Oscillatoria acuminata PCC 6304 TaxID=56110 RepID=K9TH15_9CYAN|nr:hypothetical protein [Oscillatoria acuminata]AFY81289.1 hypothetical protein Oscil6304_1588 [Oscillatoria acuminata PCC 6304]